MRNRTPMHAVLWGLGLAGQAAAQPLAPPSLGGLNDTVGAFVVATIVGAILFKLLITLGDWLVKSTGNRAYGPWLVGIGLAVWLGIYVLTFMM
jgi:hypothetical protein